MHTCERARTDTHSMPIHIQRHVLMHANIYIYIISKTIIYIHACTHITHTCTVCIYD